jgi:response regulator RpfG family c-di-GMP phosphodiesterase
MLAQLLEVTSSFETAIQDLEQQKEELEEGLHGSLRILTNLFDQTGATHGSHAGRVEKLAADIADKIGIKGNERRNVIYAALLHDVGQFGMPDAMRMKPPWTLTDSERQVFRGYPVMGAMLLSEVRGAEKVAEIVEAHAERFDGSGFPNGLKGEKIPLSARVVRIADGCDTHLMFGNHEHPIEEVRKHLLAFRGRHYDPDLIDVAIGCATHAYSQTAATDVIELPINEAYVGLILAGNVYDNEGRFLARQGAQLSAGMLVRLRWLLGNQVIKVHRPTRQPE